MKILLVRHAEPDYTIDSLTEKGQFEAELLSRRLCRLNVRDFYTSPLGRARETARHTLEKLDRHAEVLDWLQEFRGRSYDPRLEEMRICWDYRPSQWYDHEALFLRDKWLSDPLLQGGNVAEMWQETADGVDALLARYGYEKDGPVYHCAENRPDTIVLFCHFAISMVVLSHLCGIPPVPLLQSFYMAPSSVTTVVSEERVKGEVHFRAMQVGDISHLYAADERHSTAGLYPEIFNGHDTTDPIDWNPWQK